MSGGLQTVGRTAAVLRALIAHPEGLTLSELAAAVALPVSSVHRLVTALDAEGLVRAQPRGRIFLGPLITQRPAEDEAVLAPEVREAVRALSAATQETVDVAVLDGDAIRFVAQAPGGGRLRAVSSVGVRLPLHCTGMGKAFLSRMDRAEASARLPRRLPRLTAHGLTSRRALWRELEDVRATGVGFDREEHHLGIAAAATLVDDSAGTTVALGLVVPAVRFHGREERLVAALLAVAGAAQRRANSAARKSAPV
jgi:DNA-binding IclR family transcriptional regulator